ncbi:MAG: HlyC/CorC family transporter [Cytophagales bacterium]|nr:MAG: HlyC/CorC family transporter [Cytophagales bacterium]
MLVDIFITLFLVFLNGFFVAAEFAIVKVRTSELDLKSNKQRGTNTAKHITQNLDAYLAATQLGITIASIGLGLFSESVFEQMIMNIFSLLNLNIEKEFAHQLAFPTAYFFITFVHVVFGELAPKSIAIRYPLPTTMFVALPLYFFSYLFTPFIWFFNGCAGLLLKLLGISPISEHQGHSEEEIRLLVKELAQRQRDENEEDIAPILKNGKAEPQLTIQKYELLEKVFEFDDKLVSEVMVPRTRMFALDAETDVEEALIEISKEAYSRVPIYHNTNDNIIGILHTKELYKFFTRPESLPQQKQPDDKKTKNNSAETNTSIMANMPEKSIGKEWGAMLREVYEVPFTTRAGDLLHHFQKERQQMAIIKDEFGGVSGLITMEDIVEELLGEIYDEYDEKTEGNEMVINVETAKDYIVNAQIPLNDLNDILPVPIPEDKYYTTLSGYILHLTGNVPKAAEEILTEHYTFKIVRRSNSLIKVVEIRHNDHKNEEDNNPEKDKRNHKK